MTLTRGIRAIVEIGGGDIDQEVETAMAFHRRFDQRLDVFVAGDVGADETGLGADPAGHRFAIRFIDIGDDDVDAVASKNRSAAFADQRRAARNDRRFSVQTLHRFPPDSFRPAGSGC